MITHPQIVHFPIAFLSLAVFTDITSYFWQKDFYRKATLLLLLLGVLSAMAALFSGEEAALSASSMENIKSLLQQHESSGKWVLGIFSFVLLVKILQNVKKYKNRTLNIFLTCILLFGLLNIYQAGFFGGKLVYEKGVGVKPVMENTRESIP
jgi:uncharacterized membrane protein